MRLTLIVLAFIPLIGMSQTYSDYISRASRLVDSITKNGRRGTAAEFDALSAIYDSAFAVGKPVALDLYNAACSNSRAGRLPKAMKFLRRSFDAGYGNFDWMYYDLDLNPLRREPDYIAFEKERRPDSVLFFFDILRQLNASDYVKICDRRVSITDYIYNYSMDEIIDRVGRNLQVTSDTLIDFSSKELELCRVRFNNRDDNFNTLQRMSLNSLTIYDSEGPIVLEKLSLKKLMLDATADGRNHLTELIIDDVDVDGEVRIEATGSEFTCKNSTFNIRVPGSTGYRWGSVWDLNYDLTDIRNTTFNSKQQEGPLHPLEFHFIDVKRLLISDSRINYDARLWGTIANVLSIRRTSFPRYLDMTGLNMPDFECYFPFSQLQDSRLVEFEYRGFDAKIRGDSLKDYSDDALNDELTALYKRLYDHYRNRADLSSANQVYVVLKDLEIFHLKSKQHRTTEETIRLRLNQLMGFYTDHATSPGKALIISFYIILAFGIFYCFFPSDWDKTSKGKIIGDFRLFIEKNEHGYVKPFFKMLKGLAISLLNALSLSLNAFITLGFGNIPTTGIARYVCVLQGALGWFLLSLFTVALLNQVLL